MSYKNLYSLQSPNIYAYKKPHHSNNRNPESEFSLPSLVIHRPLHPQPDTEDSSQDREYPEGSLTDTPPLVYRL